MNEQGWVCRVCGQPYVSWQLPEYCCRECKTRQVANERPEMASLPWCSESVEISEGCLFIVDERDGAR